MTTPIERAAEALHADACTQDDECSHFINEWLREARTVFESIDRDELAHWWRTFDGPAHPTGQEIADALLVYLTGGES